MPERSVTETSSVGGTLRRAQPSAEHNGERLDRFLALALPDLSRSRLQALLAADAVSRSGETIRDGNTRVKPGELYEVAVPEPAPAVPLGQAIPLKIVHEDEDLIVIDKHAGLVVHPAAGNPDGTLVNALIAHCGNSLAGVGGVARPGIVHRLDKDTSGLLVAAKNDRAMASLAKQFAARTIERAYHAVAWGAPRAGGGIIEGDIGRNPFDRKRMAIVRNQGKPARTRYRMLERYGGEGRAFASLIECRLETG
ncbi:MAG TPA: RluA family pseudouridine synthase, partial [Rhizomicrobium sp.]|nr:RluA family pseudouridine synthase [Rhizomicrobium sp.]